MITDDQRPANTQRRRPEIARWTEHERRQIIQIRHTAAQIEMRRFFAPGSINFVDIAQQLRQIVPGVFLLIGLFDLGSLDRMRRKKLLRSGA